MADETRMEKYTDLCKTNFSTLQLTYEEALAQHGQPDIDDLAGQFNEALYDALDQAFGRNHHPRGKGNKWFWNDELEEAFQKRESLYCSWRYGTGLQKALYFDQHAAAAAEFKSLVRHRKRQTWREFCQRMATEEFCKTTATVKRIRRNCTAQPTFSHPAGPQEATEVMPITMLWYMMAAISLPTDPARHPAQQDLMRLRMIAHLQCNLLKMPSSVLLAKKLLAWTISVLR